MSKRNTDKFCLSNRKMNLLIYNYFRLKSKVTLAYDIFFPS